MLKQLSTLIQKRPWLVITIILLITIGFATLLPSLEMKTDFKDFMPDDEAVKANTRIMEYFGQNQQIILALIEKQQANSVTTTQALREQYYIQKQLSKNPNVVSIFGLPTIIDQVCQLEYGKTFENCSDEQIKTVLKDILEENGVTSIKLFNNDDPNEKIDYNRFPRLLKGRSADEMDIKNCYLDFNDETITFTIEVYDLSFFESKLKSPVPFSNVVEWYIDFENNIKPDEKLDISYRIAAHFEPKYPLWEIGNGFSNNIKALIEHAKNLQLFNTYTKEVYLWIKTKDQAMSIPIPLKSSEVELDLKKNQINIKIPREEIGWYGIAPRFGSFELPAKLTNFRAGTRYYETPLLKLPWLRISANTSFIFDKLIKIKEKPRLSDIAGRILKKFSNYSWEDLDMFLNMSNEKLPLPDQVALKDIENSWVDCDIVPDKGYSLKLLFYKPYFFKDLQTSAKGFLSKDYDTNSRTASCIMIMGLNNTGIYKNNLKINREIINQLDKIDSTCKYINVEVTGEGVVSTQINDITSKANRIIMPMMFITIIIILMISFRKLSYVILPLLALGISIIWTFGTMVILGIPFSTMAVAIVPLILGLGVDYSVHLSHNYKAELSKGKTPAEAIKLSVMEIGEAMFLAMLTTVIAFLSFLTATVPPMRDFGLILAIGIIYTFITAITLQAAVRYLVDRNKKQFNNKKKKTILLNVFMGKLARKILKHQKKIIAILLIITAVAAAGATQLKTEFDYNSFLPSETPSIKLYQKIQTDFPFSSQDQEYILLEGNVATTETLNGIMKTHRNLENDRFIAKKADGELKTTSIYTIIQQAVNTNKSIIKKYNLDEETYIPRTNRDVQRLYDYLYNNPEYTFQTKSILHKKTDGIYDATLIDIYITLVDTSEKNEAFNKKLEILDNELNEDIENYGSVNAIITGPMIITYKITTSLTESQILSTMISLVLAAVVLIIVYKRPTLGLIAMIPVMMSMIWILGTIYFAGYTLNIMTITVTSLTIGIGVDYAIHATERFRLVADKTGSIKKAVTETISRTGGALLIAAMTTCLGFAVLVFAPIPPQVQFGIITSTTILFSFVTSVLLLPLILAHWAKWSKKKRGYIISPTPLDEEYLKELEK